MNISVLGAGSWGTALAHLLAAKGHQTLLWCRHPALATLIAQTRCNPSYLPGISLAPNLATTSDLAQAAQHAQVLVSAVPSHALREVFSALQPALRADQVIVSTSKGIEEDSLLFVSAIIAEFFPHPGRIFALSGPSFALEVAQHKPTAVAIAGPDESIGREVQQIFAGPTFRTYYNADLIGVETGGALKNVMAIASGIILGAELGHNAMAALITRGLHEISMLGKALGAQPLTFAGLAGMGDLILTCTGNLSRNRSVGIQIGQGKALSDILGGMHMVAEGVRTARSAFDLAAKLKVSMPIVEQVHAILYQGKSPRLGLRELMERPLRDE